MTKHGTKVSLGDFANPSSLPRLKEKVIIARDTEGEMEDVTLMPLWKFRIRSPDPDDGRYPFIHPAPSV